MQMMKLNCFQWLNAKSLIICMKYRFFFSSFRFVLFSFVSIHDFYFCVRFNVDFHLAVFFALVPNHLRCKIGLLSEKTTTYSIWMATTTRWYTLNHMQMYRKRVMHLPQCVYIDFIHVTKGLRGSKSLYGIHTHTQTRSAKCTWNTRARKYTAEVLSCYFVCVDRQILWLCIRLCSLSLHNYTHTHTKPSHKRCSFLCLQLL